MKMQVVERQAPAALKADGIYLKSSNTDYTDKTNYYTKRKCTAESVKTVGMVRERLCERWVR